MTMRTVRVRDVLSDSILVTRESAHLLEDLLRATMVSGGTSSDSPGAIPLTIDFEGVEGVAPSFMDELLSVFESLLGGEVDGSERRLIVSHPPARLSRKFEAVARGHGMSVRALPDGTWLLEDASPLGA